MTLKQIMMTRPEIAKRVMEKYPLNKAERRGCESEKAKRDFLRSLYAKRLVVEEKEKKEYIKITPEMLEDWPSKYDPNI